MYDLKNKILATGLFEDNKYLDEYVNLINTSKDIQNVMGDDAIYERHHIIPVCVYKHLNQNVDDTERNKVSLTIKNHALAHYFLCLCAKKSVVKAKLVYAVMCMLNTRYIPEYDEFISSLDRYEELKNIALKQRKADMLGNQHAKGNILSENVKRRMVISRMGHFVSEQTREKLRNSSSNRKWVHKGDSYKFVKEDEVPHFLSNGWEVGGKPISEQQKEQISKANTGKKRTEEAKRKMSNAKIGKQSWNKGIPLSDSTKKKLSAANKGRKWINNGLDETTIHAPYELPDGYRFGRIKRKQHTKTSGKGEE